MTQGMLEVKSAIEKLEQAEGYQEFRDKEDFGFKQGDQGRPYREGNIWAETEGGTLYLGQERR